MKLCRIGKGVLPRYLPRDWGHASHNIYQLFNELVLCFCKGIGSSGYEHRYSLLTNESVVLIILLQELVRVTVTVNVDLGQRIINGLLLIASGKGGLEEW